ncbi:septation protein A [Kingella potus]|nr:septation protein A [Kingella potus]UOP01910.1 septation protein A [Kingella potus]
MKAASDLIAVILFFLTYIITKNIVTATSVAIAAGLVQAAFLWWKYRKLETMQWVSLLLIVVFGGATVLTGNRTFIMWKPTLLFWAGAAAMLIGSLMKKNSLRALLGKEVDLPEHVWKRLTAAWIVFLAVMGAINLAVAYPFTAEREAVWNNYKFFGSTALMFLFFLAQGIYLSRHLTKEPQND